MSILSLEQTRGSWNVASVAVDLRGVCFDPYGVREFFRESGFGQQIRTASNSKGGFKWCMVITRKPIDGGVPSPTLNTTISSLDSKGMASSQCRRSVSLCRSHLELVLLNWWRGTAENFGKLWTQDQKASSKYPSTRRVQCVHRPATLFSWIFQR